MLAREIRSKAEDSLHVRAFLTREDGSFSVEAVIWMPIFAILLALVINISMLFFTESQILRVVQEANRAFSIGKLESAAATESYIAAELAYLDAALDIQSALSGGVISTSVRAPATDLMPVNFMTGKFEGIQIRVSSDHIVEF